MYVLYMCVCGCTLLAIHTSIFRSTHLSRLILCNRSQPKGRIQNCVLNNVRCKYIDASNSILINITAERIVARGENIAYNLIDETVGSSSSSTTTHLLDLEEKAVLVGVFNNAGEQCVIRSDMDTDGGRPLLSISCLICYSCILSTLPPL